MELSRAHAESEVLDVLVQRTRDKRAALRLMRKLLKKLNFVPDKLVSDDLRSTGPRTSSRPLRATRSANGSTRMATAAYDVLEVETCGFKGPRAYDEAGLPLLSYGSYGSYNSYGSFGLQGSCSLRLWAADASNERPRSPAGATPCMAASVAFIICEAHPPSPIGSSHYLQTLQSRIGAPKRRAQSE
jgi:hypothetical protein